MDYKKIEELFVDYILSTIGPNAETETERNNVLYKIKEIIENILRKALPDFIIYVIPYGSFPVKTYLKDADIDITIFFYSKIDKILLLNIDNERIDFTISVIKEGFEKINKESETEIINDIKIIMADIRLLKCKIGNINIDISINNYAGIYKIIFINYIEEHIKDKFNLLQIYNNNSYSDNKRNLFRRTFLLIKAWCLYEGKLMGSNIGLMATYTLEILVIYIFNFYYNEISNELEGFEKFFEIMQKFNWEKEIISLYGIIPKFNFFTKLENYNKHIEMEAINRNKLIINKPFWYLEENNEKDFIEDKKEKKEIKKPLLGINDIKTYINYLNRGIESTYLRSVGNKIESVNYDKMINILDPLNNHNNLGKSINYHSKSRMKLVISFTIKKLKKIKEIRKSSNPFIYMNSLLNLFKDTLSTIDLELFEKYLKVPKIISNSKIYKKYKKNKGNEESTFTVEKTDIDKFNKIFNENYVSDNNNTSLNLEEEDYDEYEEDKKEELSMDKSDNDEEEDEDQYEEDISNSIEDNKELRETSEDSEDDDYYDIKEKFCLDYILNKEIMKKLFDLYEKKEMSVKNNNMFISQTQKYSTELFDFLQKQKLI